MRGRIVILRLNKTFRVHSFDKSALFYYISLVQLRIVCPSIMETTTDGTAGFRPRAPKKAASSLQMPSRPGRGES